MRLLLTRSTHKDRYLPWRLNFVLWARFDLTNEERMLVRRFDMERGYLTVEGSGHDLRTAALYAVIPAVLLTYILENMISPDVITYFLLLIVVYVVVTWLFYEQIREAIKMYDILNGRNFKNRSAMLMLRKERQITGYALAFQQMLTLLREQEAETVIELGAEEHAPALRLVTDTYAPA
jgi:hypothetical protein